MKRGLGITALLTLFTLFVSIPFASAQVCIGGCNDNNPCTVDACVGSGISNGAGPGRCTHTAGYPGAVCRPAAGLCDTAEKCSGRSTSCPDDIFKSSTIICRPAAGVCDLADHCTGSSATCPDAKSTAVCRTAAPGGCDQAESCDGVSNVCPANSFLGPATICKPSAGECDIADTCSGSGATCGTDRKKTPGTACTDDGNLCTNDTCNGSSVICQHPPHGGSCTDGNACTQTDTCQGGVCTGSNPVTCTASDSCHDAGMCNPATGTCSNPPSANGRACSDNNACNGAETCQNGTCTNGGGPFTTCANGDGCCPTNCTAGNDNDCPHRCGDRIVDAGEQCDDGNTANGDGCSSTCQMETRCGNGTLENGEECDDGNTVSGDGCGGTDTCPCQREVQAPPVFCSAYPSPPSAPSCGSYWVKTWDDPTHRSDSGLGIAAEHDGGHVYVAGFAGNTSGWADMWLGKYTSDGTLMPWPSVSLASYLSRARDVIVDSDGSVYVVGMSGTGDAAHIVLRKFSSSGASAWSDSIRSGSIPAGSDGYGIAINGDSLYATGTVYDISGVRLVHEKIWIQKFNKADGVALWATPLLIANPFGLDAYTTGFKAQVDSSGNLIVSGQVGVLDGPDSRWMGKISPEGAILWSRTIESEGTRTDFGSGLALDSADNIYVAISNGSYVVKKYNPDGDLIGSITMGTRGYMAYDVSIDACGNIYVAGAVDSLEPGSRRFLDTKPWIAVFSPSFEPLFNYDFTGLDIFSYSLTSDGHSGAIQDGRGATAITLDGNGSIYLTGFYADRDYSTVRPYSATNIWTAKFTPGSNPFAPPVTQ